MDRHYLQKSKAKMGGVDYIARVICLFASLSLPFRLPSCPWTMYRCKPEDNDYLHWTKIFQAWQRYDLHLGNVAHVTIKILATVAKSLGKSCPLIRQLGGLGITRCHSLFVMGNINFTFQKQGIPKHFIGFYLSFPTGINFYSSLSYRFIYDPILYG